MNEKLKPCPFCGNDNNIMLIRDKSIHEVLCQKCGIKSRAFLNKEQAIRCWNTRATGWIRTSEQKPETCEVVLAYTGDDNGIYIEACAEVLEWTGAEFFDYWHSLSGYTPEMVPYWMPIPDLPEAEE